ncbi:hypothetical protein MSIBF_A1700001 [groundwater metagenome]|uniref:KH type-2 domain-containing protein n=1 Tax=groundwater metagenome TaxID=717931 RepID=A0A098E9Z6_9ZZZZ
MGTIKWGADEIKNMTLFEILTGVSAMDCVSVDDAAGFLVEENDMGMAIGKNGENINKVRDKLGKQVFLMQHSQDMQKFITYALHPAYVKSVRISDTTKGKIASADISKEDYRKAAGEGNKKIAIAKLFANRMFDIEDIVIKADMSEMPHQRRDVSFHHNNFKRDDSSGKERSERPFDRRDRKDRRDNRKFKG